MLNIAYGTTELNSVVLNEFRYCIILCFALYVDRSSYVIKYPIHRSRPAYIRRVFTCNVSSTTDAILSAKRFAPRLIPSVWKACNMYGNPDHVLCKSHCKRRTVNVIKNDQYNIYKLKNKINKILRSVKIPWFIVFMFLLYLLHCFL